MKKLSLIASLMGLVCLISTGYFLTNRSFEDTTPKPSLSFTLDKRLTKMAPDSIIGWDSKMTMAPDDSSGDLAIQLKWDAMETLQEYYDTYTDEEAVARPLSNIEWTEMGPYNVGGRTRAILIDKNDPTGNTVWAGGISGGLWKSVDGGDSWVPIDDFFENLAVSCIAQHPTSPNIMYFGTGEGIVADGMIAGVPPTGIRGIGTWWSTDGGDNWSKLQNGVKFSSNPPFSTCFKYLQKLVVKGNGDLFAATKDNYVMRLPQGGMNPSSEWDHVQKFTDGFFNFPFITDIEIAPDGTFYAGATIGYTPQFATQSALFKSSDGLTWTRVASLPNPSGSRHRIEIACGPGLIPTDPSIVYVATTTSAGFVTVPSNPCGPNTGSVVNGLYKSTDQGLNWTTLAQPMDVDPCITIGFANGQAIYNIALAADPIDPEILYVGGIDLFRSTNGGTSWHQVTHRDGNFNLQGVHADQHVISIDENNPDLVYFGNDGGVYRTDNGTISLPDFPDIVPVNEGFRVTQLYSVAPHPHTFNALTGTQDNTTRRFDQYFGGALHPTVIPNGLVGDGGNCFINSINPQLQLASAIHNYWWKSTDGGQNFTPINVNGNQSSGIFINPAAYDEVNDILYTSAGYESNISTSNRGRIMRIKNATSSSPIVHVFEVGGIYKDYVITEIKISPYPSATIIIGTAGADWPAADMSPWIYSLNDLDNASASSPLVSQFNKVTALRPSQFPTVFPQNANISSITFDPTSSSHILVTFYNYGMKSVYEATGGTWVNIDDQITLPNVPIRSAVFNPNNPNEILVATEVGVWATDNPNGSSTIWTPANKDLANVRIDKLAIRECDNMVFAATHGRGLFMTDAFRGTTKAGFTVNTQTPCREQMLYFTDQSVGATSWEWDFDSDGVIDATVQNPSTCAYGTDVSLTINGCYSTTKQNYISINQNCASSDCTAGGPTRLADESENTLKIYPNPFSKTATLDFVLDKQARISLTIYDMNGRKVHSIQNYKWLAKGSYRFSLIASEIGPSGTYFCIFEQDGIIQTKKFLIRN